MIEHLQMGEWKIPESAAILSGELTTEDNKFFLEVFSSVTFENKKISFSNRTVTPESHQLICGHNITLYSCLISKCHKINENFYRTRYEIGFVIRGEVDTEINVISGRFTFPFMSSWYDTNAYNRIENLDYRSPPQFRYKCNDVETVVIDDNCSISFIDHIASEFINVGTKYELQYLKFTEFTFKNKVPFSDLINYAIRFRKLLEVSFFKPLYFAINEIRTPNQRKFEVKNFSFRKGKDVNNQYTHQGYMLFNNNHISKAELNLIIQQWYQNEQYEYIYDYFIDSFYSTFDEKPFISNVIFNNRFLNMVQGLEGYYDKLCIPEENSEFRPNKNAILKMLEESNQPNLKAWLQSNLKAAPKTLRAKIEYIVSSMGDTIEVDLFDNEIVVNFIGKSVKPRNDLSHGDIAETYQGREFEVLFYLVRYVLCICIIRTLNVPKEKKLVEINYHLQHDRSTIRQYIKEKMIQP